MFWLGSECASETALNLKLFAIPSPQIFFSNQGCPPSKSGLQCPPVLAPQYYVPSPETVLMVRWMRDIFWLTIQTSGKQNASDREDFKQIFCNHLCYRPLPLALLFKLQSKFPWYSVKGVSFFKRVTKLKGITRKLNQISQ